MLENRKENHVPNHSSSPPPKRPDYSPISPTSPPPVAIQLPLHIQPKDLVSPDIKTMITLWRAWPLDWSPIRHGMTLQNLTESLDVHALKPVTNENIKLYRADQGQASRIMRLMMLHSHWKNISLLDKSVTRSLPFPEECIKSKKHACEVVKIQDDVDTAIRLNGEATAQFELGKYSKALIIYLQALASLCPWSCDDSAMTFDQARATGLCDIEQQILLNIVRATLAWSLLLPNYKETKFLCHTIIDSTIQAFEFFPYTTYEGMIQISDLQHECMDRWPEFFTPLRRKLFERRRECKVFWEKQKPDDWAHRDCNLTHVCYHS